MGTTKNPRNWFEKIMEATPNEIVTVRPLISHLTNHSKKTNQIYWPQPETHIDVLLWTHTHVCASVGRPAKIYRHQIFTDTGYSLEDLLRAIDDRDGWREIERERERERE